jgi:L-alanine-DL-glutamate epimerase-like enolase superfamily enzyme
MSGFGNLQILAATSEDTCEYYERGLLAPGVDYETPPPYLEELCDPLDADGYVRVPQAPGMGYKLRWDYVNEMRPCADCAEGLLTEDDFLYRLQPFSGLPYILKEVVR